MPKKNLVGLAEGAYDLRPFVSRARALHSKVVTWATTTVPPLLDLSESGLSDADLDRKIATGSFIGPPAGTLRELLGS